MLTTHYMEEADQICDRVPIIDHGQIIAFDPPSVLKGCLDSDTLLEADITGRDEQWGDNLVAHVFAARALGASTVSG